MSPFLFCIVVFAGLLHASWNAIVKRGGDTLLQAGYYVLVARTYRVTDMSASYPVMRGVAPLLVAVPGDPMDAHGASLRWVGRWFSRASPALRVRAFDDPAGGGEVHAVADYEGREGGFEVVQDALAFCRVQCFAAQCGAYRPQ